MARRITKDDIHDRLKRSSAAARQRILRQQTGDIEDTPSRSRNGEHSRSVRSSGGGGSRRRTRGPLSRHRSHMFAARPLDAIGGRSAAVSSPRARTLVNPGQRLHNEVAQLDVVHRWQQKNKGGRTKWTDTRMRHLARRTTREGWKRQLNERRRGVSQVVGVDERV